MSESDGKVRPGAAMDTATAVALLQIDGVNPRREMVGPGGTVQLLVASKTPHLTPAMREDQIRVTVGKRVVPVREWSTTKLELGDVVTIVTKKRGKALKSILAIVVLVAAIALGQFYAPALAGATGLSVGTAGTLITGAVGLIGTFLLNALIPVKAPKAGKDDPSYRVDGFQNTANPGGVMPSLAGEENFAPPFCHAPVTEIVGDNQFVAGGFVLSNVDEDSPIEILEEYFGQTKMTHYPGVTLEYTNVLNRPSGPLYNLEKTILQRNLAIELRKRDVDEDGTNGTAAEPSTEFTKPDIEEFSVDISFPTGIMRFSSKGKKRRTQVRIRLRYRKVTALGLAEPWIEEITLVYEGKTTRSFIKTKTITVPERGPAYEVELLLLTDDANERRSTRADWGVIRSIRPEYPINSGPGVAVMSTKLRAARRLSGTVNEVRIKARRHMLDYEHTTGDWVVRPTKNVASIARHYLRGKGERQNPLPLSTFNMAEWEHLHDVCRLKNYNFNYVFADERMVFETVLEILSVANATLRFRDGKWGVFIDEPQEHASDLLVPSNVWGFEWQTGYRDLPDALRIPFRDETSDFKDCVRFVKRPGYDGPIVKTEELRQIGITHPRQVYLWGYRRFLEIMYRSRTYTVNQDDEWQKYTIGQKVDYQHYKLTGVSHSGYVAFCDPDDAAGPVMLSDIVSMVDDGNEEQRYAITFRNLSDDGDEPYQPITREVIVPDGGGDFGGVFLKGVGPRPKEGDLYSFGLIDATVRSGLIHRVEMLENDAARVSIVDEAPEIEEAMASVVVPEWSPRVGVELPPDTRQPAVPVIISIDSSSEVYGEDETPPQEDRRIVVSLKPGGSAVRVHHYEIQHRLASEPGFRPTLVGERDDTTPRITSGYDVGEEGVLRARAVSSGGVASEWTELLPFEVGAEVDVGPSVVTLVPFVNESGFLVVVWDSSETGAEARIRYSLGTSTAFADMTPLVSPSTTASPLITTFKPATGSTYRIGVQLEGEDGDLGPIRYEVLDVDAVPLPLAPDDFDFTLNGSDQFSYAAKSGTDDENIARIEFRRGRPGVPAADAIAVGSRSAVPNLQVAFHETIAAPPGVWRGWALGRNDIGAYGPATQSDSDITIPGQVGVDDFSSAGGLLTTNPAWTRIGTHNAEYQGGKLAITSGTTTSTAYVRENLHTLDHWCSIELYISGSTMASFPVSCRAADQNNHLGGLWHSTSGGRYAIYRRVGGGAVVMIASAVQTTKPVDGTELRLEVAGPDCRLLAGGVEVIPWTPIGDSGALVATRVAVIVRGVDGVVGDNFKYGVF